MAVEVTIKSKGLFKTSLKLDDILENDMRFGIMDDSFRFDEGKVGEITVIFNNKNICRGFEVSLKRGKVELRMPLPTSDSDITFFYETIKKICIKMNTKVFVRDEEILELDEIDNCIKQDLETSRAVLKDIEEKIKNGTFNNFYIFGAINPVALGKNEMKKIKGNPIEFGNLMHQLQSIDAFYAAPKVYQKEDTSNFGVYVLTEGIPSILPDEPKLLLNGNNITVDEWNIGLVIDGEVEGFISYNDFLKNIKPDSRYDSEHFLITIDKDKIKKLVSKYKIDL